MAPSYTDPRHRTRCSHWYRRPPLLSQPRTLRRQPARPPEQPTRRLQLAEPVHRRALDICPLRIREHNAHLGAHPAADVYRRRCLTSTSTSSNTTRANPVRAGRGEPLPEHHRRPDWKGHPMSGLGPLQMFDILSVRRDVLVREFYVYLLSACSRRRRGAPGGSRLVMARRFRVVSPAAAVRTIRGF